MLGKHSRDDVDLKALEEQARKYSKINEYEKMNTVKKRAVFYHELYEPELIAYTILIDSESKKKENIPYDAWYKKNGKKTRGTAYFLTIKQRDFVNEKRERNLRPHYTYKPSSERFDVPDDAEFVLYIEPDSYNILESTINDSDDSEQTDDSDDDGNDNDSDDSNPHALIKNKLELYNKANPKESFYKIEKLGEKFIFVPTEKFDKWSMTQKGGKSRRIKSRRIKSRSRQTRRR